MHSPEPEAGVLSGVSHKHIRHSVGQTWVAEDDLRDAGYDAQLGEVIAVRETHHLFELAGRVVPFKVGLPEVHSLVWWLLPVTDEHDEYDEQEGGE